MSLSILKSNPALAAQMEKKAAVADTTKAHHVAVNGTEVSADGNLIISIPLTEIAKARPSKIKTETDEKTGKEKTTGGNLGFMLDAFTFEVDGHVFKLGSAWHTFSAQ